MQGAEAESGRKEVLGTTMQSSTQASAPFGAAVNGTEQRLDAILATLKRMESLLLQRTLNSSGSMNIGRPRGNR